MAQSGRKPNWSSMEWQNNISDKLKFFWIFSRIKLINNIKKTFLLSLISGGNFKKNLMRKKGRQHLNGHFFRLAKITFLDDRKHEIKNRELMLSFHTTQGARKNSRSWKCLLFNTVCREKMCIIQHPLTGLSIYIFA